MCPAAAPAAFRPCASVAPGGERGGVLGGAGQLDAERVVGQLADDAGAREDLCERARELLLAHAATSPAPACTISWAWAGPPMQATRSGAEARAAGRSSAVRPVRRHEALGDGHDRRAPAEAGRGEPLDHLAEAVRGHRQEHVVGARDAARRPARCAGPTAAARPGGSGSFSRCCSISVGLLVGAGLQRRAQTARARAAPPAPCRTTPPRSRSRAVRAATARGPAASGRRAVARARLPCAGRA